MKQHWDPVELIDHFTLLPHERELVKEKSIPMQIGFAALLKYFQVETRFPSQASDLPKQVVKYLSQQLGLPSSLFEQYPWGERITTRHRSQIRKLLGFRETTEQDAEEIKRWLLSKVMDYLQEIEPLKEAVYFEYRRRKIEPPTDEQINRMVHSAIHTHELQLFEDTYKKLPSKSLSSMDALIRSWKEKDPQGGTDPDPEEDPETMTFRKLALGPGAPNRDSLLFELEKLKTLRDLALPENLFDAIPWKLLQKYRQRAISEEQPELRRHPPAVRYTLLAAFFWSRSLEITDNLVELLITIVHKINARAGKKVDRELIQDIKRVRGKQTLLTHLLEAALESPDDAVRDVLYPVVDEETLRDWLKELKHTQPGVYQEKVYVKMRSSYSHRYRSAIAQILDQLEFRSNNPIHRPVLQALEWVKRFAGTSQIYFSVTDEVPIKGVVRPTWMETVLETDPKGNPRVNRINYEIAVLYALRDRLRCKEIWVAGANRYRNPEEDLPSDFEQRRSEHYEALKQPLDAELFISELQKGMHQGLERLNRGMPKNKKVSITSRKGGWISVSPLGPQSEPPQLARLKREVSRRWWMVKLLDIFTEADLRLAFTDEFRTFATHERLNRKEVRKRLLLCLYGLGTNTGIKRVSTDPDVTYKELLYTKRKYIHRESLRAAIAKVVNAILAQRITEVWGAATTSCASDSKKFSAWDQNLMTEWHVRYRGRGVMVYWHVEEKSVCIYSQLKTCSSSEVASMIEGVLRHCTDKEVDKTYVDTHGQSEVGFAFCHLLGFQLMPRLKNIGSQKLAKPEPGAADRYPNLALVMGRNPIDWDLIRQQYDQMVKYATALRLGTAEAEAILKRFAKNKAHPTYKALHELGRAVKTIFLCNYLHFEEIRREIEEGLNVIENWNSANDFIFYGDSSEITKNQPEEQEISILCLHLIQNCLVYINTLKIQRVLREDEWRDRMTPEDFRALTPLIYNHVTPYGDFYVNLDQRLSI